ncbi:MAG: 16S rRNA (guanine(527)-N(7))-methyltransferase RsmG, partial [Bacteroidales bacterium]
DLGTGGGFPGIPLAIYYPQARFVLVDSIGKKLKVAQAIASSLQLENVEIKQSRAEEVDDTFQFVVSRAVAKLPEIAGWMKGKFAKQPGQKITNGIFCLKGGNLTEETLPFPGRVTEVEISDYFREAYFTDKKIVFLAMK